MRSTRNAAIVLALILLHSLPVRPQRSGEVLGIRMPADVPAIITEIEQKTRKPLRAEFAELDRFELGTSYIDESSGAAVLMVNVDLDGQADKLRAVIVHELLHLRLRVNNYPTFIFSPNVKTAKGRAIDVEQGHVNDLRSIIEHRVFKAEMERYGVYKFIDLAGDTAADARRRRGDVDGQADSINYSRALLEYSDPAEIATVKRLFQANGWTRALRDGAAIADLITRSEPRDPADVKAVFLECLKVLFPLPNNSVEFTLTRDPSNRYFTRLVIDLTRRGRKTTRRGI